MKKRILLFLFITLQIALFHHVFALAKTYLSPENYFQGKFYTSVKNSFLISTERMNDSRFKKSVIAMFEHDEDGAWGLVINKPMGSIPLAFLLDSSISTSDEREKLYGINILIFWGGPVEVKKIFVLHSSEYQNDSTKNYGGISISQDYNILLDIAENKGPEKSLVILGYSGWRAGQLENEMERDDWILSDLDPDIIFEKESNKKWPKAYENSFIRL